MPEKFKLAVLVSGRGSNLQAIIDKIENNYLSADIALVLSNVKNAFALDRGKKHGLDTVFLDPKIFPNRDDYELKMIEIIQSKSIDLICLAGFMRILGKNFIPPDIRGKVTGKAKYAEDFRVEGMLFCKLLTRKNTTLIYRHY